VSGSVLALTPLPGRPRWALYDSRLDRFWINIMEPGMVAGLNTGDLTYAVQFAVDARGPHGLALDAVKSQLFVACDDARLITLSTDTGETVADITLAGSPDVFWLNAYRRHLYLAIGNPGMVQVMALSSGQIVEELATDRGAHTLTFDNLRQHLYVFLPESCRVAVYDETVKTLGTPE
jgi:hypothetical protein